MLLHKVKTEIISFLKEKYNIQEPDFEVMGARNLEDGDFFTNAALKYAGETGKKPMELAEEVKEVLGQSKVKSQKSKVLLSDLVKIQTKQPGFLNFYYTPKFFYELIYEILDKKEGYGKPSVKPYATPGVEEGFTTAPEVINEEKEGRKIILEYMQPNTNKPLHVGHLRNLSLGTALINILNFNNWDVKRATINNDRGLHIIKSMWGYLFFASKENVSIETPWKEVIDKWVNSSQDWREPEDMEGKLKKPDHFLGSFYVKANKHSDDDKVKSDWHEMLKVWENTSSDYHQKVRKLWQKTNNYFYRGYRQSAERFQFSFDGDYVSYESEIYDKGRERILEGLKEGIFQKEKNDAVRADLSDYNLPDKILIRGDGTGIYMTFDVELTRQRSLESPALAMWVVGSDQDLYFKQLFAVCEMLGFGNCDDYYHYSYGMVRLPEGKMSSRKGTVVYADDLLSSVESAVEKVMEESKITKKAETSEDYNKILKQVSLGALKWSMICVDPVTTIPFDLDKSVSFSGFSGPYIQYTHARANSVIKKSSKSFAKISSSSRESQIVTKSQVIENGIKLNEDETALIRTLAKFPEEVQRATQELAPHYICHYLFSLAQAYNTFYGSSKIIDSDNEAFRISLTECTAQVLKNGLNLLGIASPDSM